MKNSNTWFITDQNWQFR